MNTETEENTERPPPMRTIASLLVAASFLVAPETVHAKTLPVPGKHPTLQGAIDAAGPGDVITVKGGVYRTRVVVPADKTGLTIRGIGKPILDAFPQGGVTHGVGLDVLADDVRLENLIVRHARYASGSALGIGIRITGDGARLDEVHVADCDWGGLLITGDGARLEDCSSSGNGFLTPNGYGLYVDGDGARVLHCSSFGDHDGITVDGRDLVVRDCDVRAAGGRGIYVNVGSNGDGLVRGCTVRGSGQWPLIVGGGGSFVAKKNVFEGAVGLGVSLAAKGTFFDNIVRSSVSTFPGLEIASSAVVVADNTFEDLRGPAIRSKSSLATIVDNKIERCGSSASDAVLRVTGSQSTIMGNRIRGSRSGALEVSGSGNVIVKNKIVQNHRDGLVISGGTGHEVRDNNVKWNGGEGIENLVAGTIVTGNNVVNNRLDVAATAGFGEFAENAYVTGGPTAVPEFD